MSLRIAALLAALAVAAAVDGGRCTGDSCVDVVDEDASLLSIRSAAFAARRSHGSDSAAHEQAGADLPDTVQEVKDAGTDVAQQVAAARAELKQCKSDMKSRLAAARAEVSSVTAELEEALEELVGWKKPTDAALLDLQQIRSRARDTGDEAAATLPILKNLEADLQGTGQDLQREWADARAELQKCRDDLASRLAAIAEDLASVKADLQEARQELAAFNAKLRSEFKLLETQGAAHKSQSAGGIAQQQACLASGEFCNSAQPSSCCSKKCVRGCGDCDYQCY